MAVVVALCGRSASSNFNLAQTGNRQEKRFLTDRMRPRHETSPEEWFLGCRGTGCQYDRHSGKRAHSN